MSEVLPEEGSTVDVPEPTEALEEAVVETPEPVEPSWSFTEAEYNALNERLDQLAGFVQPPPPEPVQQSLESYADPVTGEITAESLQAYVQTQIQEAVQARVSPYEPILNQTVSERGEQIIAQKFESLKTEVGDFNTKFARSLAEGYAATGVDPDSALRQAAKEAYEFAQAERQAGVEQYKTTLQNIGSAPREGAAAGAGVLDDSSLAGLTGDQKYKALADRWVDRHSLPG